ncbi:MAG TPA: hypothetical protein P5032_00400 [Candidatus Competibacter sp.]|nr:hypothetical protein [Candidatus Competibacteraceae bacterium]HRW64206.1 hypothetical protein [Candidatus Competibacter sp.]
MLALAGHGVWAADQIPVPAASSQAPSPKVVGSTADEALLKERVLARWQALIDRKFDAIYQFETPAYRAIYTPSQVRSQNSGQLEWRMVTVKKIDYDGSDVARIQLEVAYRYADPGSGGQPFDMKQTVREIWLRKDGQWWHQQS